MKSIALVIGTLLVFIGSAIGQDATMIKTNLKDTKVVAYYIDKKIKPEENIFYYWVSKREIHQSRGGYSGQLLNGDYEEFYLNNQLKSKGVFLAGCKNGVWKQWYETGELKSLYHWKEGRESGEYKVFDSSGVMVERGMFRNGVLHGDRYVLEGELWKKEKYKKGELVVKKEKEGGKARSKKIKFRKKDIHQVETGDSSEEKKRSWKNWWKSDNQKDNSEKAKKKKQKAAKSQTKERAASGKGQETKRPFFKRIGSWWKKSDKKKEKEKGEAN